VSDTASLQLLHAYTKQSVDNHSFARDALVIGVPHGNPGGVKTYQDLGSPPPEGSVCTPPWMLAASATPLDQVEVPIDQASSEDCGQSTLDAVARGDLAAALLPGSAITSLFGKGVERVAIPAAGNLSVTYRLGVLSRDEATLGFANYVSSKAGRDALVTLGYRA
jgi:molybdate transport system substrate-binding protein